MKAILILLFCFSACAQPLGPSGPAFLGHYNIVPEILWWRPIDGAGTTVTATIGPNGATDCSWTVGQVGGSYSIEGNGTSQEAQTVSSVTYSTNIITVAFWLFTDSMINNAAPVVVESSDTAANPNIFSCFLSAGLMNLYSSGTSGLGARNETITWENSVWRHVLVVYDQTANSGAGEITIYTNGVSAASSVTVNTKTGTANFSAQTLNVLSRNAASLWVDGKISSIKIFSGNQSARVADIMKPSPIQ